jgi:hypothetical protein
MVTGFGDIIDEEYARLGRDKQTAASNDAKANGSSAAGHDYQSPGSPGSNLFDRLAKLTSWADILEPAGWTQVRPPDAMTLGAWHRPGGTYEVSAKVLKANPHVLVVHSEDAGLPSGAGQKNTKARVLAHLHYRGDESAFAKALARGEAVGLPPHVVEACRGATPPRRPAPADDEPPEPDMPDEEPAVDQQAPSGQESTLEEFWDARPVLGHIRDFARARRVGPWALLGCVLVRVVAIVPPNVMLEALVGGYASLNLYVGIVSVSGGGKGTAENAALDAIDLDYVPTFGPGSGEGIGHLFYKWDRKDQKLKQHTTSVIISAAEIDTLAALKTRQASTLFPELRKVWMGEPLGFAYVADEKRLTIPRHSYRLCLITGIQPANASPILDDHTAGTPQRFLWLPADDPDAPEQRPPEPEQWPDPLWTPHGEIGVTWQPVMHVCDTARAEIDQARLAQLRGQLSEALDGHALLGQLKVAAALALLHGRTTGITEQDWQLAGVVRAVSDQTRQRVIHTLDQATANSNRARAEAEAQRAIHVGRRLTDDAIQRVSRALLRQLDAANDWITHSTLRGKLPSRDRKYFSEAIAALKDAGQIDERPVQGSQDGTEYRRHQ